MYSLPLPINIGGTKLNTERQAGPPSKLFPALRDMMAEAEAKIAIEVDTAKTRYIGVINRGTTRNTLYLQIALPAGRPPEDPADWKLGSARAAIKLEDVIAFRVRAALVEDLPFRGAS